MYNGAPPPTGKELPYEATDHQNSDEKGAVDASMQPLMFDQTAEASSHAYVVAEVNGNGSAKSRASSVGSRASHSSSAQVSRSNTLNTSASGDDRLVVDLEARAVSSPLTARVAATPVLSSSGELVNASCCCYVADINNGVHCFFGVKETPCSAMFVCVAPSLFVFINFALHACITHQH